MMKSSYWQERFLKEEQRRNKDARVYLGVIEKQYDKALRNIEKDINDWYARLAKNNDISLKDAKMLLSKNELKEFHRTIEEYIQKGKENAVSQEWMKQLENASAKVHISKLEALKVQIQNEIEGLYGERLKGMEDYLERVYGDTYYRTVFSVQQGLGIGWSLASLDTNRINQIIHKPWAVDGKNFSERLWEDKTKLINTLHTGLTQNIIRGFSPDNLIKQIAKEFGVKKSVAGRLVMTESAAYSSKAQEQCFKDLDVEKYEIIATLDTSTSAICREMDGKVFLMKDYLVGVTANPFHPNCRTVTAPYFEDDTNSMRAMRTAGGKTEYVPANMKYDEWFDKYVKEDGKNGIIEKRHVIVEGKNIINEWKRRKEFEYEIDDIVNYQGFDGLPRLVKKDEFKKLVEEDHFIAKRSYSASSLEELEERKKELYYGKWYINCSTGGAQYGQGMYCAADYTKGTKVEGIMKEMEHYSSLNKNRGNPFFRIETLTLDKSAKILDFDFLKKCDRINLIRNLAGEYVNVNCEFFKIDRRYIDGTLPKELESKNKDLYIKAWQKMVDDIFKKKRDIGAVAVELGYDAINARGHGASDSYTVILNRTKLIILDED